MNSEDAPFTKIEILWSFTAAATQEAKRQELLFGAAFAKIVSLMMHSPTHKDLPLSDLPWLIVPPLLAGQIAIVEDVTRG